MISSRSSLGVLTLLLLLASPISPELRAQDFDPPDDPSLRLVEDADDSIAGGMPSVGIREMLKIDRRFEGRHAITLDPALALLYANLSYDRALNRYFTVGGRLIAPVPILSSDEAEKIWGIGGELRMYIFGEGAEGSYVRVAPTFYAGTYDYERWNGGDPDTVTADFSLGTVALDLGWRWIIGKRIVTGLMVGAEWSLNEQPREILLLSPAGSSPGTFNGHFALRLGYTW